jgi:ABC-2 type transport system ATP-binding protein
MGQFSIKIQNLSKTFGRVEALKSVSLEIPSGRITGLLGPNGAGKTTLIKAMAGSVKPSAGNVSVFSHDPVKNRKELRKRIGYMPQNPAVYEDLSARENIMFFARLHGLEDLNSKTGNILEFTGLADRADDPVHTFSGGMKKRVSLACALVHDPELLFLDEPTAAIDPVLRKKFWEMFRILAVSGKTIIISTHLMDEALHCDMLTMLSEGRMLLSAAPQAILKKGRTEIAIGMKDKTFSRIIENTPESMAAALHEYGLSVEVNALDINKPDIEKIFLELMRDK